MFRPDPLFSKPNAKLLEEILRFLLSKISPEEAQKRLLECWPITSATMAKKFRVEILKWMEELRAAGKIPRDTVPRKSMLEEGVGERLEECLARLAEYLIRTADTSSLVKEGEPIPIRREVYALESFMEGSAVRRIQQINEFIDRALGDFGSVSHENHRLPQNENDRHDRWFLNTTNAQDDSSVAIKFINQIIEADL